MHLQEDKSTASEVSDILIAAGYGDVEIVGKSAYTNELNRCFVGDEAHLTFGTPEQYTQHAEVRYLPHAVAHSLKCAGYEPDTEAYEAELARCFEVDETFQSPRGELRYFKVDTVESLKQKNEASLQMVATG